ncbi:MAG: ankyrin repeat domain-containing protein [Planctomycetales bacterium]
MRKPVQFNLQLMFWLMLGGAGVLGLFRWMKHLPAETLFPSAWALTGGVVAGAVGGLLFWNYALVQRSVTAPLFIGTGYLIFAACFLDHLMIYGGGLALGMLLCLGVDSLWRAITPDGSAPRTINRDSTHPLDDFGGASSSQSNETTLHHFAREGSERQLAGALDLGIPVDSLDDQGRTPLHWAVVAGRLKAMLLLLGRGADVNRRDGSRRDQPEIRRIDHRPGRNRH